MIAAVDQDGEDSARKSSITASFLFLFSLFTLPLKGISCGVESIFVEEEKGEVQEQEQEQK